MTHCIHAPRDTSMQTDCGCGNRVTDLRKARRSQTFLHHAGQLDRRFASSSSSSSSSSTSKVMVAKVIAEAELVVVARAVVEAKVVL